MLAPPPALRPAGVPGRGIPSCRWRELLGAATLYGALTVVFTSPLALDWSSVPDHHDSLFSIWRLAWIAHQLPLHPSALFDANIFHPAARTLAYSDATLLQALLAAPLLWSGVPAVVAYNLLSLGSFVGCGLIMLVVVTRLTGSSAAGLVAGTIAAFGPFRLDHLFHLELLWGFWVPAAFVLCADALRRREARAACGAAACVVAQFLSCIYFGVFLGTLLSAWVVLLVALRLVPADRRTVGTLALMAAIVMLVTVPYAIPYALNAREVGARTLEEATTYSAMPASYLTSPASSLVYGWTYARWGANELQLFPGFTALVLAAFGLWRTRTRMAFAYGVLLLLAVDLSLGVNGLTFPALRSVVPLYQGLRVPARAGSLALSLVAILAGYGVAALLATPSLRGSSSRRRLIVAALVMAASAEYLHGPVPVMRLRATPDAAQRWMARLDHAVILELPCPAPDRLPGREAWYQYRSTFHWQRLVNGYSGFYPPAYLQMLNSMATFPDARSLAALRRTGATHLLVHEAFYESRELNRLRQALDGEPTIRAIGRLPSTAGSVAVYQVSQP